MSLQEKFNDKNSNIDRQQLMVTQALAYCHNRRPIIFSTAIFAADLFSLFTIARKGPRIMCPPYSVCLHPSPEIHKLKSAYVEFKIALFLYDLGDTTANMLWGSEGISENAGTDAKWYTFPSHIQTKYCVSRWFCNGII